MINKEILQDLKDKYWNIYYTEIAGVEFLFRELSRHEYKKVLRVYDDPQEQEEYICRICVIEPEEYDFEQCPAGIPSALSQYILVESGFGVDTGKIASYLERYRAEMATFDNQISCIIHEAFPTLLLEEIEDWPMEKQIFYLSRSEYILNELRHMDLQYVNGDKQQVSEKPAKQNIQRHITQPEVAIPAEPTKETKPSVTKLNNELVGSDSDMADFPELKEIKKFMDGKLF